jgi:hypothetical protein
VADVGIQRHGHVIGQVVGNALRWRRKVFTQV